MNRGVQDKRRVAWIGGPLAHTQAHTSTAQVLTLPACTWWQHVPHLSVHEARKRQRLTMVLRGCAHVGLQLRRERFACHSQPDLPSIPAPRAETRRLSRLMCRAGPTHSDTLLPPSSLALHPFTCLGLIIPPGFVQLQRSTFDSLCEEPVLLVAQRCPHKLCT